MENIGEYYVDVEKKVRLGVGVPDVFKSLCPNKDCKTHPIPPYDLRYDHTKHSWNADLQYSTLRGWTNQWQQCKVAAGAPRHHARLPS